MMKKLTGRIAEQEILQQALDAREAELVAVVGRRRVGKTFLINTVYKKRIVFEITGIQNANRKENLDNFVYQLGVAFGDNKSIVYPENWLSAFVLLVRLLEKQKYKERKVIFLDELPWLATHRSGFLKGLDFFWNSWAVKQNIVVVICGSAASWMIKKVVDNKGGLHNRITKRIFLAPFTLGETKAYLKSKGMNFDHYQILQLYMAIGGVPHYLSMIEKGRSAIQNIDKMCFSKNGLLRDEFSRLYPSLFANAENHVLLIRALAAKKKGLTRKQIVLNTKLPDGGRINRLLKELEHSGFIDVYYPFGKRKKEKLYRLIDEYSLFYLRFIEGKKREGTGTWQHLSQTQSYKSWSGYAFESICIKHLEQIKKALSIAGIYSESSSFFHKGSDGIPGAQIDLVLDRNDHNINLFEIKFYNKIYTLTKAQKTAINRKLEAFIMATGTNKRVSFNLVATYGLKHNQYSLGLIENVLTMDDLFST